MTAPHVEKSLTHDDAESPFQYCPKCAARLGNRYIEQRLRQACSECDFIYYRDPKPVAGTLALKDGKILLIQRGNEPKHGFWSFPTGYIDIGDTPEETAIREAKEESNVDVDLVRLLGVYSDTDRTVVLIVYVGRIVSGVPKGSAEALDARLFDIKSLPELAFDHDYQILEDLFNTLKK
ncbi:MAG: NUDIX domain-containing protein [Candidatus Poribacteria bacterium]|nr:NUDIX domain-containing protein [Candidatus Poribacteria bacterium]MDE0505515.1 NUDIX domain-containing protein [Candidatus Poribacteria bacterium]